MQEALLLHEGWLLLSFGWDENQGWLTNETAFFNMKYLARKSVNRMQHYDILYGGCIEKHTRGGVRPV
jgi:hypothetical protein